MWPFSKIEEEEERLEEESWEPVYEKPGNDFLIFLTKNDMARQQMSCESVWESDTRYMLKSNTNKIFINKEDVIEIEIP